MKYYFYLYLAVFTIFTYYGCKKASYIISKNDFNYVMYPVRNDSILLHVYKEDSLCYKLRIKLDINDNIKILAQYKDSLLHGLYFETDSSYNEFKEIACYKNGHLKKRVYFACSNEQMLKVIHYPESDHSLYVFNNNYELEEYHFFRKDSSIAYSRYYKDGAFLKDSGYMYIGHAYNQEDYFSYDTVKIRIMVAKPPKVSYKIYFNNIDVHEILITQQISPNETEIIYPVGDLSDKKSTAMVCPVKIEVNDIEKNDTIIYKDTLYFFLWSVSRDSVKRINESLLED